MCKTVFKKTQVNSGQTLRQDGCGLKNRPRSHVKIRFDVMDNKEPLSFHPV